MGKTRSFLVRAFTGLFIIGALAAFILVNTS